jgi:hypothetical protein
MYLFLHRSLSHKLSDEFGHISRQNSACSMMVVPVKMDKNVKKIHTHTLSGVKGSTPGAVPNEEGIIILDESFSSTHSAVNLQVRQIQNRVHTFIFSLIIFLPHHYCHPSFLKCSA